MRLRVVDLSGGSTEEIEVMAYLVKNRQAEVPIILGFADLLEKYELVSNYPANRALLRKAHQT